MADQLAEEFAPSKRNSEVMKSFGYRLRNQFFTNEAYRRPKELEWLESLRQYRGLYDPDVQIEANASKVYPKITRSKVNIVLSRLHTMLFPEDDRNFEVDATPEPSVDKSVVMQIAQSLVKPAGVDPQTGQPIPPVLPTAEELNIAIKKFAKETAAKMQNVIDDQLTEMEYPEETKKVLRSGLMYGTGVMKGPMIKQRSKRLWVPIPGGDYEERNEQEEVPDMEFVRIWDWYPDMSTVDIENIEGSFQRHVMTKHDLRQLAKREDFYADIILQYLQDHPDGDYVPKNWEVDMQVIEVEAGAGRHQGEARVSSTNSSWSNMGKGTSQQFGKKYEVLEYWGYVDGKDLEACGVDIPDVQAEYAVNCWLLGTQPIKSVPYEAALGQYKVFYYEKDETSIFGESLARIMRHSQLAIAGAARMVLDNGAACSGPQVEVNYSLMVPGTDLNDFYPRKIWFREGRGVDSQYPALRVYNIDSHIQELLSIVSAFKEFGDEETTLPTWMLGQVATNETAQGFSGRMSTITISIKDIVKNFDAFTEHVMRDLYAWNMEFNPRKDIKGDYLCKARGSSSLILKELRAQALTQLKQTMQPEDWDYVPRRELLDAWLKTHDLRITLRTDEEVQRIVEQRTDQEMNQLVKAQMAADVGYTKAQTFSQLGKAKKANVEAVTTAATPPEVTPAADPRLAEAELHSKSIENAGKMADIQRADEQHRMSMMHADEKHRMDLETGAAKTAVELGTKVATTEHGMKMKEKVAKMQKREKTDGKLSSKKE